MDITFHTPRIEADGRTRIEDAEWGRWMILVDEDGTATIRDYDPDVDAWLDETFPDAEAAKAHVNGLYRAELAKVGL